MQIRLGTQIEGSYLIERSNGTKYNQVDCDIDYDNNGNYYNLLLEKEGKWFVAVGYDRNITPCKTQYFIMCTNTKLEAEKLFGKIESDTINMVSDYYFS